MNSDKYRSIPSVDFPDRKWPSARINKAPIWCSVDLRDGNQALEVPMTLDQKVEFFKFLCEIGFKEIEIGFPAASETDYNFCRYLIDNGIIPEGVAIQVLTQSRPHIIEKTMEAVKGAGRVIIHLYNSTSTLQRDVVFGFSCEDCIKLATEGAEMIAERINSDNSGTEFIFEYSPESFSSTEPEFAVKICDSVMDVIKPTPDKKAIVNLPETVEYQTANVYADQVEYFCTNTRWRDSIVVSLHTHNDRGTAVATSEFGLMAGADRVEGTLFGNGERTGNVDIITLAINMLMTGVDPELDFSDMNNTIDVYEDCTGMKVEPRHPWAGKLVFTAFSGSHQDAISKGRRKMEERGSTVWAVPYLPIDPKDVGREYEPIIRINSQSGRGGISYVMQTYFGITLPKSFLRNFLPVVKAETEKNGNESELSPKQIFDLFDDKYINVLEPYGLKTFSETQDSEQISTVSAVITDNGKEVTISGTGNGLLDAFVTAFKEYTCTDFEIKDYSEHAMKSGSDSAAITFIEIRNKEDGKVYVGAGVSSSVTKSSVRAIVSAYNRMISVIK
ncbi:MAG: 2-isopropylmalate synthase [Clostridiales bacterium]|nr:2-isopropylmalate synthase [Clostridiales bacterium]